MAALVCVDLKQNIYMTELIFDLKNDHGHVNLYQQKKRSNLLISFEKI